MILITNDDGYSKGLELLLKAAKQVDEAYAIIPSKHRSAVSSALTIHKALRINKHSNDIYTLSGTPADCVYFSLYCNQFKKPDLILSGLNFGDNTAAEGIICSGTVGACWIAATENIPSIAFSLYINNRENWKTKEDWGNEKEVVSMLVKLIKDIKPKIKENLFFTVNMPLDISKSKIIYPKKLQRTRFDPIIEKREDPHGIPYYWLSGNFSKAEKDTDFYEVKENGNIVVTPISIDFLEKSKL